LDIAGRKVNIQEPILCVNLPGMVEEEEIMLTDEEIEVEKSSEKRKRERMEDSPPSKI